MADEIIPGARRVVVGINDELNVTGDYKLSVGRNLRSDVTTDQTVSVGKRLIIEAGDVIELKVGHASLILKKDGTIELKGKEITLTGSGKINVKSSSDVVIKGSKVSTN